MIEAFKALWLAIMLGGLVVFPYKFIDMLHKDNTADGAFTWLFNVVVFVFLIFWAGHGLNVY